MLVTFRFKNFGPFRDESVLDMRAIKSNKEHPYNVVHKYEDMPLLKIAAIYGANASGKTNFMDAYICFRDIVTGSFQENNKDEDDSFLEQQFYPFLLDTDSSSEDTEFEAVYRYDNTEYTYGFSFNRSCISYEWLYRTALDTKRRVKTIILERSPDKIDLGPSVRKVCEKYIDEIDTDVLALSFFSSLRLKVPYFYNVVYLVNSFLPVYLTKDSLASFSMQRYFEKEFNPQEKDRLLKFLHAIDIGIKDISVEKNGNRVLVYTYHTDKDGEMVPFPIEIESDGTRRAIALYSMFSAALSMDKGLLLDEMHSQLHPLLQKYLLDLFYDHSNGAQLIYTTHDTTLLDAKYTRRDQIWFVSKDEMGASTLYSLSDFNVRKDQSYKKAYLSGLYGAIPNLKDFSLNGGTSDGEG